VSGSDTWGQAARARCGHTAEPQPEALIERLRVAEDRIENLERALASQRQIGIAIGLLAHRFGCSPEQGWQLLVRLSQATNVKVRELARIIADAHCGQVRPGDAAVMATLAAQLPRDRRPGGMLSAGSARNAQTEPLDG
jgi:hypothetical protein